MTIGSALNAGGANGVLSLGTCNTAITVQFSLAFPITAGLCTYRGRKKLSTRITQERLASEAPNQHIRSLVRKASGVRTTGLLTGSPAWFNSLAACRGRWSRHRGSISGRGADCWAWWQMTRYRPDVSCTTT